MTESNQFFPLHSFCMVFAEQPNMSDPNADFLQPYKKVSHKMAIDCFLNLFYI